MPTAAQGFRLSSSVMGRGWRSCVCATGCGKRQPIKRSQHQVQPRGQLLRVRCNGPLAGVNSYMPKALNADWNLAQALYVQGVPYRAIAKKVPPGPA